MEIVETGTNVPLPFRPVPPLDVLAAGNPHVLAVMLRQLRDMKGAPPDTSGGVLKVMTSLTDSFKTGQDVTPLMPEVSLHLTGRTDRRELIRELSEILDDERLMEIFKSRSKFEDFLHGCQRRSDVNIIEGVAIQTYLNNVADKIQNRRARQAGGGDYLTDRDPQEMLTRANLVTQAHRRELQHKFNEATPQEREILRKLGFRVQTMVAARLTRTKTTTETIDLVN